MIFGMGLILQPVPSLAQGKVWCKAQQAPQIKITASANTLKYDFTQTEDDLGKFKIDTKSPYAKHVITDVGGLMKGGIEMRQTMQVKNLTHSGLKQVCMWYSQVAVDIKFDPTIYIAKEFPPGSCRHKAIMGHEMKHVQVDRQMVNKYAALIGKAIQKEIDAKPVYGPASVTQKAALEKQMNMRMEQIMKSNSNIMDAERSLLQQQIDSIEEYERVNNLCPQEKPKRR